MSARIFFAGAAVGALVGALAVVAFQTEKASTPIAENEPTATVRKETTSRSNTSNMESELRDYLARRPVPNGLGSTSVECRTSVCRILSVVGDDVVWAVPNTDLQAALANLPDESLGREVVVMGVAVIADSKHPGQMIEVAFLRRADKPSNSSRP